MSVVVKCIEKLVTTHINSYLKKKPNPLQFAYHDNSFSLCLGTCDNNNPYHTLVISV